jgi:long-chain acyl-CoA synthetase
MEKPSPYRNFVQVMLDHFERQPDKPCLRFFRDGAWKELTYGEVRGRVLAIAGGLVALGIEPGDRAAILSANRPEWALCDLGTFFAGAVVVTVYPDLNAAESAHILAHSESRLLFLEDRAQLEKVLSVREKLPALEHLVLLGDAPPAGAPCRSLDDLERLGREHASEALARIAQSASAPPETPLTIVYTSGTTGEPKGVITTHGNVVGVTGAVLAGLSQRDIRRLNLSFLPLAHSLERIGGHFTPLRIGGTIAYARGLDTIAEDLLAVRPEFAVGVPRFFEKFYDRVQAEMAKASPLRRRIFGWALNAGMERSRRQEAGKPLPIVLSLRCALADRLVFSKVRRRLGGRLEYFVSGGAPLSAGLARFFHAAGVLICEGYGATETSAPATLNSPTAYRFGTVGRPLPGVEVRLAPDGELLVRGPNVCAGYYKDPRATAEAFDAEGFYHTGDIGSVDADGFFLITDRKKELIITASGKNIAPTKIENLLKARPFISQALAHCDRRPYVVALLSLDRAAIAAARPELADAPVSHPEVRALVAAQVDLANESLPRYEQVKDFRLVEEDFSAERGEMTVTFKLKRRVIEERYRGLLDEMYAEHVGRDGAL